LLIPTSAAREAIVSPQDPFCRDGQLICPSDYVPLLTLEGGGWLQMKSTPAGV